MLCSDFCILLFCKCYSSLKTLLLERTSVRSSDTDKEKPIGAVRGNLTLLLPPHAHVLNEGKVTWVYLYCLMFGGFISHISLISYRLELTLHVCIHLS